MNTELWSYPDEESQRRTLRRWLIDHDIIFNEEDTIEELTQLYRDAECGII